jgi:hypothetical protein
VRRVIALAAAVVVLGAGLVVGQVVAPRVAHAQLPPVCGVIDRTYLGSQRIHVPLQATIIIPGGDRGAEFAPQHNWTGTVSST